MKLNKKHSDIDIDRKKRRFLISVTAVVGGAGLVAAAIPFITSMTPSARARSAGAPVKVDISKLEPGQQITVKWRGKPVWVLHRTPEILDSLSSPVLLKQLRDPESKVKQQPVYARNATRALKPQYLVMIGICTHLGCVPTYRPDVGATDLSPDWLGGYFCPCHGSRFDSAGRVFKGVPAPVNLVVPPYRYLSDTIVEIGMDSEDTGLGDA